MRNIKEFFSKKRVVEKLDNTPVALPVGFKPDPEADRVQYLMRTLIRDLENKGVIPNQVETFEESLQFDIGDDEDGDVLFAAQGGGVSQSEIRYMQEERMLTEAEEASRMVLRRSEDAQLAERLSGERRIVEGRKGFGGDGSRSPGKERSAGGEQPAKQRSDAGASEEPGK